MKNLSQEELLEINGGWEWLDKAAFMAGAIMGMQIDFAHGVYDGLMGTEAH